MLAQEAAFLARWLFDLLIGEYGPDVVGVSLFLERLLHDSRRAVQILHGQLGLRLGGL